MRLTIKSLGSISSGSIDLAPLTVLVGPNNTNKTWAAYSLYACAKAMASLRPIGPYFRSIQADFAVEVVSAALDSAVNAAAVEAMEFFKEAKEAESNYRLSRKWFSDAGIYPLQLRLGGAAISSLLRVDRSLIGDAEVTVQLDNIDVRYAPASMTIVSTKRGGEPSNQFMVGYEQPVAGNPVLFRSFLDTAAQAFLSPSIRKEIESFAIASVRNVLAFPAERIAIASLFTISQEWMHPSRSLSMPVYDYGYFLNNSWAEYGPPWRTDTFSDISSLLETSVLNGSIRYGNSQQSPPARSLDYAPAGKGHMKIHSASSIVKSMAGISVYLGMAAEGDIVIIDEPEMNAHPGSQLAIAELLAMLVNRGVRIVITTHSPYIVDHLMNLVRTSLLNSDGQKNIASRLKLHSADAILAPDKLAVYLFGDGRIEPIFDRASVTIDWSTFSDQSNEINSIGAEIYELMLQGESQ